jgi:hypothetical protein
MALIRRGGSTFYIRSVRRGGRVTSAYVGSGLLALGAAMMDAEAREERAAEAAAWRHERSRMESADKILADLCRGIGMIAQIALEARGFHQHKRQWRRKRRMSKKTETTPMPSPGPMTLAGRDEASHVLRRALDGDREVLPRLRELLDTYPNLLDGYFAEYQDIATAAEVALIEWSNGTNLLRRELLVRDLNRTAETLTGTDATPTERLLARRAALCWHAVNSFELQFAKRPSITVALSDHWQKQIDRAHRRLLQTLRALELVRRLARPDPGVRVSVSQHVSVEAPAPAAEPAGLRVADLLTAAPRG